MRFLFFIVWQYKILKMDLKKQRPNPFCFSMLDRCALYSRCWVIPCLKPSRRKYPIVIYYSPAAICIYVGLEQRKRLGSNNLYCVSDGNSNQHFCMSNPCGVWVELQRLDPIYRTTLLPFMMLRARGIAKQSHNAEKNIFSFLFFFSRSHIYCQM